MMDKALMPQSINPPLIAIGYVVCAPHLKVMHIHLFSILLTWILVKDKLASMMPSLISIISRPRTSGWPKNELGQWH